MDNFEAQLKFYKKRYNNITLSELELFFDQKYPHSKKPGLIISFDDAHRSNFVNAVPLLEKYGFTGWFMIPSGVVEYNIQEQKEYIGRYWQEDKKQFADGRLVMSWEEVKLLEEKKHTAGCHTFTHHRMVQTDSDETLQKEIVYAKKYMEEKTGHDVSIYCWVGGEEWAYTKKASDIIKQAGFKYSFMTNTAPVTKNTSRLQIQRTNIEADNPVHLLRFQLGLLMDTFYYFKRKRVNKLTQ